MSQSQRTPKDEDIEIKESLKKIHPEFTEIQINDMVAKANSESQICGTFKYIWFISPLGWLFNNKEHNEVWNLTFA